MLRRLINNPKVIYPEIMIPAFEQLKAVEDALEMWPVDFAKVDQLIADGFKMKSVQINSFLHLLNGLKMMFKDALEGKRTMTCDTLVVFEESGFLESFTFLSILYDIIIELQADNTTPQGQALPIAVDIYGTLETIYNDVEALLTNARLELLCKFLQKHMDQNNFRAIVPIYAKALALLGWHKELDELLLSASTKTIFREFNVQKDKREITLLTDATKHLQDILLESVQNNHSQLMKMLGAGDFNGAVNLHEQDRTHLKRMKAIVITEKEEDKEQRIYEVLALNVQPSGFVLTDTEFHAYLSLYSSANIYATKAPVLTSKAIDLLINVEDTIFINWSLRSIVTHSNINNYADSLNYLSSFPEYDAELDLILMPGMFGSLGINFLIERCVNGNKFAAIITAVRLCAKEIKNNDFIAAHAHLMGALNPKKLPKDLTNAFKFLILCYFVTIRLILNTFHNHKDDIDQLLQLASQVMKSTSPNLETTNKHIYANLKQIVPCHVEFYKFIALEQSARLVPANITELGAVLHTLWEEINKFPERKKPDFISANNPKFVSLIKKIDPISLAYYEEKERKLELQRQEIKKAKELKDAKKQQQLLEKQAQEEAEQIQKAAAQQALADACKQQEAEKKAQEEAAAAKAAEKLAQKEAALKLNAERIAAEDAARKQKAAEKKAQAKALKKQKVAEKLAQEEASDSKSSIEPVLPVSETPNNESHPASAAQPSARVAAEIEIIAMAPTAKIDLPLSVANFLQELQKIGAKRARLVGGFVRDTLAHKVKSGSKQDFDIVSELPLETILQHFRTLEPANANRTIRPGGKATVIFQGVEFDIYESKYLQLEVADKIAFISDARSRDFTRNALYADKDGNIFDPLECGIEHAQSNRLVPISKKDNEESEAELWANNLSDDPIRIFRAFNFLFTEHTKEEELKDSKDLFFFQCALNNSAVISSLVLDIEQSIQKRGSYNSYLVKLFSRSNVERIFAKFMDWQYGLLFSKLFPQFSSLIQADKQLYDFFVSELINANDFARANIKCINLNTIYKLICLIIAVKSNPQFGNASIEKARSSQDGFLSLTLEDSAEIEAVAAKNALISHNFNLFSVSSRFRLDNFTQLIKRLQKFTRPLERRSPLSECAPSNSGVSYPEVNPSPPSPQGFNQAWVFNELSSSHRSSETQHRRNSSQNASAAMAHPRARISSSVSDADYAAFLKQLAMRKEVEALQVGRPGFFRRGTASPVLLPDGCSQLLNTNADHLLSSVRTTPDHYSQHLQSLQSPRTNISAPNAQGLFAALPYSPLQTPVQSRQSTIPTPAFVDSKPFQARNLYQAMQPAPSHAGPLPSRQFTAPVISAAQRHQLAASHSRAPSNPTPPLLSGSPYVPNNVSQSFALYKAQVGQKLVEYVRQQSFNSPVAAVSGQYGQPGSSSPLPLPPSIPHPAPHPRRHNSNI